MSSPERAALELSLRPAYRPKPLRISMTNAVVALLVVLGVGGIAAYVSRIAGDGGRESWAYPTAVLMVFISFVAAAPLIAYASRATRGYWGLPSRRIAELFVIPSLLSMVILIPVMMTLPPLKGRANLWFDFAWGAPFFTDALALGIMLVAGLALLWVSLVPDLAANAGDMNKLPRWRRMMLLNWKGSLRNWKTVRVTVKVLGAFYLMAYVFVAMVLTTDLGQSLMPGWRSGVFPAYHLISGIQGGVAAIIIVSWLIRRFSPEAGQFIGNEQALNLGKLLLGLTLLWFYFFYSDFIVVWYGRKPSEVAAVQVQTASVYLVPFLIAVFCQLLIPIALLIFNGVRRNLNLLAPVALIVIVGQVFDRIRLFVPAMTSEDPFAHSYEELPNAVGPDLIDILFIVGFLALAALAYLWAARRFPIHSGWELREGAMLREERKFMKTEVLVLGKPD